MLNFQIVGLDVVAQHPGLPALQMSLHWIFLLGYVKTKVYKHEITDIDDLKTKITEAVASVRPEMLVNTWNEVKIRLEMLRENGGRHVEG